MRELDEVVRNKKTGSAERVLKEQLVVLSGANKFLVYSLDKNCYYPGDNKPAIPQDKLADALKGVRWQFSKVERGVDSFPPTPENIEAMRKEAILKLSEGGKFPSAEEVSKIYLSIAPTHIEADKRLADRFQNIESALIERLARS